jgi:hypothetical protein
VASQCSARAVNKQPCKAPATDSGLCFWHDPEHAKEAAEARRLGGLRRRKEGTVAGAYEFEGLDSVPKIRRLLEIATVDTLSQENSISRNRTLAYLAQMALKALEVGEHEERLAALETLLEPRQPRRKR